jgi:ssDNA-binding Zn-finger/Zn-ribbon topoisomerase 1
MEQVAIQNAGELLAGFNDVLGQHMERLLGFKLGPAGMPLTVTTLACLALLSEREDELKESEVEARYTAEGFLAELSDLGLREYGDCEDILRQLTEKDYVRTVREGGIMPNPVALRLEELLERIFPKMPELNFVAYVTQTMGEVKSGRKELALALSQFDQTLTMQGVSVVKRKPAPPSEERPPVPQRDLQPPISSPKTPLPPPPRREPNVAGLKVRLPSETQGPRVLGSAAASFHSEVREFSIGEIELNPEGTSETASVLPNEPARASTDPEPEEPLGLIEPADSAPSVKSGTETEIAEGPNGEDLAAPDPRDKTSQSLDRSDTESGDDVSAAQEAPPLESDEEENIEQQILAFEEELSLWCPLCNKGRVEASTTPTGKTYYKCASRDCHFVSWGKPLHHPCPRCKNPFLIQVSDKSGRMAYKCPRATCHFYRLIGDGGAVSPATGAPARKVVRRRVVRRRR